MEGLMISWMFCELHMIAEVGWCLQRARRGPSVGTCYSEDNNSDTIEETRKKEMKGRCLLSIT